MARSSAPAPPPGSQPRRALVLAGGGARGAYEAGVLRFILEKLPARLGHAPRMDVVGGTSVGAIHACFLAATAERGRERAAELVRIWDALRVEEVFDFGFRDLAAMPRKLLGLRNVARDLRAGRRPDRLYGLLDTRPLERLVLGRIPWPGIRANLRAGHLDAVCVAATQIATGRAVVFVEQAGRGLPPWASQEGLRMQPIRLMPVHALASAAIPLLFPAVRVGGRYFADGGLRLNTPLAPAVRLGANRVLVIGLAAASRPEVSEALAQQRTEGFGSPGFLFGKVLNALLLSPVDADIARLRFINDLVEAGERAFGDGFLERLNAARERPVQKIHDLVIRPSVDLGRVAGDVVKGRRARDLSPFLRLFLRLFGSGAAPQESDLLSYLLFDRDYAAPLIELGEADAERHEEALLRFFSDEPIG